MIPALWTHLGGMGRIREIKEKIKPEYLEVDLVYQSKVPRSRKEVFCRLLRW